MNKPTSLVGRPCGIGTYSVSQPEDSQRSSPELLVLRPLTGLRVVETARYDQVESVLVSVGLLRWPQSRRASVTSRPPVRSVLLRGLSSAPPRTFAPCRITQASPPVVHASPFETRGRKEFYEIERRKSSELSLVIVG